MAWPGQALYRIVQGKPRPYFAQQDTGNLEMWIILAPNYWWGGNGEGFFAEDTRVAGIETRPDQVDCGEIFLALVIVPVGSAPPWAGKERCSTPSEDCKQMEPISAPSLFCPCSISLIGMV